MGAPRRPNPKRTAPPERGPREADAPPATAGVAEIVAAIAAAVRSETIEIVVGDGRIVAVVRTEERRVR